jgi:hypothetical protein
MTGCPVRESYGASRNGVAIDSKSSNSLHYPPPEFLEDPNALRAWWLLGTPKLGVASAKRFLLGQPAHGYDCC